MHELDAIKESKTGYAVRQIETRTGTKFVRSNGIERTTTFMGRTRESFPEEVYGHLDFKPA